MERSITYTRDPDNTRKVYEFIGEQPKCPVCGGYGEYEDNGPKGCMECNSRLIAFMDVNGKRTLADWDDTIIRDINGGLRLEFRKDGGVA